jgi:hypothetical protein
MGSQLKSLNTNISAKNKHIRSTYKSLKRVRVYFIVRVYDKDTFEPTYESSELKSNIAKRVFESACNEYIDSHLVKQLIRVQTGGYVGGIILSGNSEVIQSKE